MACIVRSLMRWRRNLTPYFFIFPSIFLTVFFLLLPLIQGILLSFTEGYLRGQIRFVGLSNFVKVVNDPYSYLAFKNTIFWVIITIPAKFMLGLAIALLLNETFKGKSLVGALTLIPWIVSPVVAGLTFKYIYSAPYGILNSLLVSLRLISSPISWLGESSLALFSCMMASIWKGYPFCVIVLLAGLQAIPRELYEAAMVDGTNTFQRFLYITLPQLRKVILVLLILETIWTFYEFDMVYVLTRGGPGNASLLLGLLVYFYAFEWFQQGLGSALAIFMLIMLLIIYLLYRRLYK